MLLIQIILIKMISKVIKIINKLKQKNKSKNKLIRINQKMKIKKSMN